MTIQILGSGCAKCNLLEQQAQAAVAELGLLIEIEKVSNFAKISDMGDMTTPAFAVDNVVKTAGKILSKEQIMAFIKAENLSKAGS